MNIKLCNRDIVVGLVAAVVGATLSSTMLPTDTYGYVITDTVTPHSIRDANGTVNRSADTELREQERRVARLRQLQEEERLYGSAEDKVPSDVDAMTYYQAYLYCRRLHFTRSRFHACIETVLETGSYTNY